MNIHVKAWREAQKSKPAVDRVYCHNWDPSMDDGPQRLRVLRGALSLLKTIGVLVPVDEEAVAASPGIQSWSKPGGKRSGRTV